MLPAAEESGVSNGGDFGGNSRLFEPQAADPRIPSVFAQLAWRSLGFWSSDPASSGVPESSKGAVFGLMAWK